MEHFSAKTGSVPISATILLFLLVIGLVAFAAH